MTLGLVVIVMLAVFGATHGTASSEDGDAYQSAVDRIIEESARASGCDNEPPVI